MISRALFVAIDNVFHWAKNNKIEDVGIEILEAMITGFQENGNDFEAEYAEGRVRELQGEEEQEWD